MRETILGRGVLSWDSLERVTDRYGTVRLRDHPGRHSNPVEIAGGHEGATGILVARVIEARQSAHVDLHRGIYSAMPSAGEVIILGYGELARAEREPLYVVGLIPPDGRAVDWLEPVQLYRAIDQTVDLIFRIGSRARRFPPRMIAGLSFPDVTSVIPVLSEYEIHPPGSN